MNMGDLLREGVGHHTQGRLVDAERCYRRILLDRPGDPDALHLLGVVAHQSGRQDSAIKLITRALRVRPDVTDYESNLGDALHAAGRLEEAAERYAKALALAPDHHRILNKLGVVLRDMKRPDEALERFRAAARIDPSYAIALSNLGTTLRDLGRFEEAAGVLRRAVTLAPKDAAAHTNLANVLFDLGRLEEAEAWCRTARRLDPNDPEASFNLSTTLLAQGRLREAWPLFESRWHVGGHRPRELGKPLWTIRSGAARRVLVHAEQGLGDTIQFCRFALPAADALPAGGSLFLEVQAPLRRLLEQQNWPVQILERGGALPEFDEQCALMSLPGRFDVGAGSLPGARGYLKADPARQSFWQNRTASLCGMKVGIVWAGNPAYPCDARRSVPAALLASLSDVRGVSLVSLQTGDQSACVPPGVEDWTAELDDFAETAALIAALDLVVSVDTAAAHLAGALGKPVWLLNRFDSCWRWMRERSDSIWYSTVRQFRQPSPGDWTSVVDDVRMALQDCAR